MIKINMTQVNVYGAKTHLDLAERVRDAGFDVLAIEVRHTVALRQLPLHHADPFDRILLAQADADGFVLVTRDPAMDAYGVPLQPC